MMFLMVCAIVAPNATLFARPVYWFFQLLAFGFKRGFGGDLTNF
jgi:hypothetical protein